MLKIQKVREEENMELPLMALKFWAKRKKKNLELNSSVNYF